jgi:hypothetical protein
MTGNPFAHRIAVSFQMLPNTASLPVGIIQTYRLTTDFLLRFRGKSSGIVLPQCHDDITAKL